MGAHVAPRVGDVARLGDDLEAVGRVEQQAQAATDDDVVVGDDDLDRIGAGAVCCHGGDTSGLRETRTRHPGGDDGRGRALRLRSGA